MADANITKRALAKALRELMAEQPLEKINVRQICERCGMNRKSFYYHFRDKYDLVNWIFDTDIIALVRDRSEDARPFLEALCFYLYEERSFYRRALRVQGQNSFSEHFREFLSPLVEVRLREITGQEAVHPICIDLCTDAVVCAIERWLLGRDIMPPQQFVSIQKSMVQDAVAGLYRSMVQEQQDQEKEQKGSGT